MVFLSGEIVEANVECCAMYGTEVDLACNTTRPPADLFWQLNGSGLAYFCRIVDTKYEDLIQVQPDCSSTNGIFNLRINNFNESVQGIYTCLYNDSMFDTLDLVPKSDPDDTLVCKLKFRFLSIKE